MSLEYRIKSVRLMLNAVPRWRDLTPIEKEVLILLDNLEDSKIGFGELEMRKKIALYRDAPLNVEDATVGVVYFDIIQTDLSVGKGRPE